MLVTHLSFPSRWGLLNPGPVGVHVTTIRVIDSLIGVRAEVVALRLRQVLRQPRGAIAVKV